MYATAYRDYAFDMMRTLPLRRAIIQWARATIEEGDEKDYGSDLDAYLRKVTGSSLDSIAPAAFISNVRTVVCVFF